MTDDSPPISPQAVTVRTSDFIDFIVEKRGAKYICTQCGHDKWSIHNFRGLLSTETALDLESPVIGFEVPMLSTGFSSIFYGCNCANCGYMVYTLGAIVDQWLSVRRENPENAE